MRRTETETSQSLDYRSPLAGKSEDSAVAPAVCLGAGVCSAAYFVVFRWYPAVVAALNLPALVVVGSWPVVCLLSLIMGVAGVIAARHSRRHWRLAAAGAALNVLVAGYGLWEMIRVIAEFSRAWSNPGVGP
jgi:hypothetical protein